MDERLKPCPFCGNTPHFYKRGSAYEGFYLEIYCETCNVKMELNRSKLNEARKAIVGIWNKRV